MASNRNDQAGDQPAVDSLSQAEIRALAYFAIGVSSEGSNRGHGVSKDLAFTSFAEVKTNGFTGKPDYVISGRDHAPAGAEVFIALRNTSVDNPLRQAWQGVLQDPLENQIQFRSPDAMRCETPAGAMPAIGTQIQLQTFGQIESVGSTILPMRQPPYATNPNIAAEYETVKNLFVLPEEGKRFVEATDRGEAYAKVFNFKGGQTAGFFASGENIAVWNRDGRGHALVNNTWHAFSSADVDVVKNKDGTTDLNLVHGNSTTRLLHVDPAAPNFREVRSKTDSTEALQHSPVIPAQPGQRNAGDSGGQRPDQEQSREITPSRLLKYCFRVRKLALFAVLRLMLEPRINDLRRKYYCKIVFSGCVKQYFSSLLAVLRRYYSTTPHTRTTACSRRC